MIDVKYLQNMISKKINQLATEVAPDVNDLLIIGDPTTGQLKKVSLSQISGAFGSSASVSSVGLEMPTGLQVTGSPITTSGVFQVSYVTGYAIPTTAKQSNWDAAYNFFSNFPAQTGNSGKVLSTNGTSLSWISLPSGGGSNLITSVFGRTGDIVAVAGDYNTDKVTEGTNLYYTQARFDSAFAVKNTDNLAEGSTNQYFTNARARGVLSTNVGSALTYNSTTGRFTLPAAESGVSGYLTGADYDYFSSKQDSIGTGTASQFLRGDLQWATPETAALSGLIDVALVGTPTNGQALIYRYGEWRNETISAGSSGVTSFNTRTGAVTLSSADVTGALGYTPYNSTNPNGYITGITSGMVTGALGYTPYNSTNPAGYITASGKADGAFKLWAESHPNDYYIRVNWTGSYWQITSNHSSGVQVAYADSAGYSGSTGYVAWGNVGGRPTALSQFSNDLGNYGGFAYASQLSSYLPLSGGTISGSLTATGGFFESSDKRLKTELSDNPIIDKISTIKPKLYLKNGKEELGYYAQDFKELLPCSVSIDSEGFLSLSYTQIHTAKIAQLEGELKELKEIIKNFVK